MIPKRKSASVNGEALCRPWSGSEVPSVGSTMETPGGPIPPRGVRAAPEVLSAVRSDFPAVLPGANPFWALMSATHDLKSPLAGILQKVRALLVTPEPYFAPEQVSDLVEIERLCVQMGGMVDECYNFGLIECGEIGLALQPGDLGVSIRQLYDLWRFTAQRKRISLALKGDPGGPVFLFDSPKVQRVISNLVENALKYTPEGGAVSLQWETCFFERRNHAGHSVRVNLGDPGETLKKASRAVHLSAEMVVGSASQASASAVPPPGGAYAGPERRQQRSSEVNAVRICVSDNGPGIPAEDRQEIFEPFVRGIHKQQRGLGLGLAIARRFVNDHGGRIWVESEVGEGSCFYVLLPLRYAAGERLRPAGGKIVGEGAAGRLGASRRAGRETGRADLAVSTEAAETTQRSAATAAGKGASAAPRGNGDRK